MKDEHVEAVVKRLLTYAPTELDRIARRNVPRCIGSTRIGIDVLTYFGVPAEPIITTVLAANAAGLNFIRRVTDGGPLPSEEEWKKTGGWVVQTQTEGGDGYPGHLVIGLTGRNTIIDLDVIQFARPAKKIIVPRVAAFDLPPGWWDCVAEAGYVLDEGGRLVYQRMPRAEKNYVHTPDWRKRGRHKPAIGALIRRIRAEVPS